MSNTVTLPLCAISLLVDSLYLEKNTTDLLLADPASVNVQSGKWKLLYLVQEKGDLIQGFVTKPSGGV